jgi:hypothetical protein
VSLPEQERYVENRQIHLERRSPCYWRVTFDHPPLNIFGPETIPQLNEVITALENDTLVKVVVFDSAVHFQDPHDGRPGRRRLPRQRRPIGHQAVVAGCCRHGRQP